MKLRHRLTIRNLPDFFEGTCDCGEFYAEADSDEELKSDFSEHLSEELRELQEDIDQFNNSQIKYEND